MPEPLLTRRAVVLAKIESSYNVDATPNPATDAALVADPDYSIDVQIMERNLVRWDLDQVAHRVGSKLASMKFSYEWRSNGRSNSGLTADAPMLGRLLRGCGFAEAACTAGAGQVGAVNGEETNTSPTISWTGGGTWALTQPIRYTIEVTTGGASGVAAVSITPDAQTVAASIDAAQTGVTITSASALQLKSGGSGLTLTPTWTGNLVLGDKFYVWVFPVGLTYMPISSGVESLTLYMYFDGLLHKMTGARGSFSISAEAGGYAKVDFTYTGQYVAPVDAAMPTSTAKYEQTVPAVVENSQLFADTIGAIVGAWSIDVGNTISKRPDVNSPDGYNGVRLTGRDVKGQIDPEMTLVADYDWWGKLANGSTMLFRTKVGQTAGNRIWALAVNTQFGGMTYKDRESIRAADVPLKFNRRFGNDSVIFCVS